MPLRNFSKNTSIDRTIEDLKSNTRHFKYIKLFAPVQLHRLLTIIKDKISGLSLEASVARNNAMDTINPEENLNKVDDETLKRKKLTMDNSFEKHRKLPGDPDFEYNVEVEFEEAEEGEVETAGWDSGDSDVGF